MKERERWIKRESERDESKDGLNEGKKHKQRGRRNFIKMKLERMRRKSNDGEETYREAGEEVDRDCTRNSEEENEKEIKINFIDIFQNKSGKRAFSPFYSPESPLRLGSHCLTGLAIACLGQPIKPFKHFHFGGPCCPSSFILHFLTLDSPLCLLFWRVLLLFLLYSS